MRKTSGLGGPLSETNHFQVQHRQTCDHAALFFFAGIPDLAAHAGLLGAIELSNCLRGPADAARSTWDRLYSAVGAGLLTLRRVTVRRVCHAVVVGASACKFNRAVDSVRFLLDRGVTLSWRVVGESTRAVPMESPPRHLKDRPACSSPVLASQF